MGSKISNNLVNFLQDPEVRKLLNANEFETIYHKLGKLSKSIVSEFSILLQSTDIDPLPHMTKIPSWFGSNLEAIEIPENIKRIGDWAFDFGLKLKDVKIPDSVTAIGIGAFYNCQSLTEIKIPDSVVSIEDKAFFNCVELQSVKLSQTLDFLGGGVFEDCNKLENIVLPNSLTTIPHDTFNNCFKLASIIIPTNIVEIEKFAFGNCESLKNIIIPEQVNTIGDGAFAGCTNLSNLTLGQGVKFLGANVFQGCKKLKSINYSGTKEQWGKIYFNPTNKKLLSCRIKCTDGDFTIKPKNKSVSITSIEEGLKDSPIFAYNDSPSITIEELFDLDYLYHATYIPYLKEIKKSGYIIPGKHKNWDISNEASIYLSRDIDDAASYAENAVNVPEEYLDQIVVLKIDPRYLDINKLDIDHNQSYSYDGDIDPDYPETWVQFEYGGEIPAKAIIKVIKYD